MLAERDLAELGMTNESDVAWREPPDVAGLQGLDFRPEGRTEFGEPIGDRRALHAQELVNPREPLLLEGELGRARLAGASAEAHDDAVLPLEGGDLRPDVVAFAEQGVGAHRVTRTSGSIRP